MSRNIEMRLLSFSNRLGRIEDTCLAKVKENKTILDCHEIRVGGVE